MKNMKISRNPSLVSTDRLKDAPYNQERWYMEQKYT